MLPAERRREFNLEPEMNRIPGQLTAETGLLSVMAHEAHSFLLYAFSFLDGILALRRTIPSIYT
jgi:hypothetical protein